MCLPNVIVLPIRYHVERFYASVIQPELACMLALWKHSDWKYFINLTGQEFPGMTNLEIVRTLKAYKGHNVMINGEILANTTYGKRLLNHMIGRAEYNRPRLKSEKVPPHDITLMKGPVHIAATRGLVDYILHDPRVGEFLHWVRDMRCSDESFFASLHYAHHLGIPGAVKNISEMQELTQGLPKLRYKVLIMTQSFYLIEDRSVQSQCLFCHNAVADNCHFYK